MVHMDITPYIERLRSDLMAAAEGAGPDVSDAAAKLGYALDPATRLALMEAISHAAAEITAEMPEGGVDVRLDGRDLAFVVHHPLATDHPVRAPPPDDDGNVARITLRLPESTKSQAEDAAAAAGQSLNTWLGNVIRNATADAGPAVTSGPFGTGRSGGNHQMTGWV